MKKLEASLFNFFTEAATLSVENPLLKDPTKPFKEATVADLPVSAVRAVYPEVAAAHSDRLTKNFTWYSTACLKGQDSQDEDAATGLYSFVRPYGKPFLREHRSSDFFADADVPMGRVIFAGYKRYKEGEVPQTPLTKPGYPGTAEGTGHLVLIPGITDEEAIERVLSGTYHTVSIGSHVGGVIESISGKDIAALARDGKYDDMPEYRRGQVYNIDGEQKLSYWIMKDMHGIECSFVNVPADSLARVTKRDIGESGIRLLLGEKKPGAKEFALYDAISGEKVPWAVDEGAIDESFNLVDSLEVGRDTWLLGVTKMLEASTNPTNESASEESGMGTEKPKLTVDQITVALPDIAAVKALKESEEYDTSNFSEVLAEALNGTSFDEKLVKDVVEANLAGYTVSNETLFQETLDRAIEVTGEFNETSTILALTSYVTQGETLAESGEGEGTGTETPADDDTPVTLGELYALEEAHVLFAVESTLTKKTLAELDEACFAGEGKTFPVTNLSSAVLAIRLGGFKDGVQHRSGAIFLKEDEKILISPAVISTADESVALLHFESEENLAAVREAMGAYPFSEEEVEKINKFLGEAEAVLPLLTEKELEKLPLVDYSVESAEPVLLGEKFLLESFKKSETGAGREHLLHLVALARSQGLSKEEIGEAAKAYTIFGMRALESLWAAVPEKASSTTSGEDESQETSNNTETSSESAPPVQTQSNPAVASVSEGDSTGDSKPEESWTTKLGRPLRRPSGKSKNTKEKR